MRVVKPRAVRNLFRSFLRQTKDAEPFAPSDEVSRQSAMVTLLGQPSPETIFAKKQYSRIQSFPLCRAFVPVMTVKRTFTTTPTTTDRTTPTPAVSQDLQQECHDILQEASVLTRSLYRLCLRSVKIIRQGNAHDAAEFAAREEKQLRDMVEVSSDERLTGIISMLPPVEPEAELKSRSEYYAQYANETFFAESDCLRVHATGTTSQAEGTSSIPHPHQFARYFYYLRQGEEHRQWLLQDMKFEDPFRFDLDRVDRLEQRVQALLQSQEAFRWNQLTPEEQAKAIQAQKAYEEYDSEAEAFSDEEDDE